ncbi:SDR family oxidoreductase [Streptomyces palmae]|uniref:SDR family oxidoreductase n=1 Tax=Streptomyces palmae TaxID=1701085 RepID=A0A4Z0GBA0_9ACTN|nr:SDR family oxidoreductase [Streptomyces palmae]TGA93204.1 SDR family oxidoreductase [Streptomyces palmae]
MPKYTGRKAVVVGGTTGVGLAIAKRLVEGGARTLLTGGAAHGIADVEGQLGPAASLVACDLFAADAVADFASAAGSAFGTVDMLFVDAEPAASKPWAEPGAVSGTGHHDGRFTAAARGAYTAAQALAPLVADEGAIVFTTVAADVCRPGTPDAGVRAMTASAVHALTRVLAVELADRGVRVNAVSPGAIDTPADALAHTPRPEAAPPLGRRGSVDEVARAALFLATDATFTTGTVLAVDGGLGCGGGRPGPRPAPRD